ncbi:uncharacterized protein C8Q71DRAFT_776565 [Rhodofomes roseus]|uniref:Secreted protein n=1 Tax=Rhodofomes roseus TaxID=34475 RepID=A0ABQ8K6H5_9APHY|nr:uncharacterized protein C8Q71DRAFT_776565 [Rhodofomes roseus]KAH9832475.1 hypothetical protein C8Q71DRAFT_776565 [Rhodofomes roseus]
MKVIIMGLRTIIWIAAVLPRLRLRALSTSCNPTYHGRSGTSRRFSHYHSCFTDNGRLSDSTEAVFAAQYRKDNSCTLYPSSEMDTPLLSAQGSQRAIHRCRSRYNYSAALVRVSGSNTHAFTSTDHHRRCPVTCVHGIAGRATAQTGPECRVSRA